MNGGGNPSVGGGGFAASPAGTAPLYYKSAEIASGSAKNLCKKSGDVGGCARLVACLPCLYLLFCPLSPHPPSPAGKGEPQSLFRRGFAPGTPAFNRLRHLQNLPNRYPAGGLPGWSPAYPAFTFFSAPYPPDPLPRRGRGRPRLFHARGFAPCIPGAEPEAALARRALAMPAGAHRGRVAGSPCRPCSRRGACLLCRPPTVPFACFSAPYPPSPLPRRGRGCPKVYFAGGFAPGTPAFNRLRHLQSLPSRYPKWGFASCEAGLRRRSDTLRRCAFGVASSAQNR